MILFPNFKWQKFQSPYFQFCQFALVKNIFEWNRWPVKNFFYPVFFLLPPTTTSAAASLSRKKSENDWQLRSALFVRAALIKNLVGGIRNKKITLSSAAQNFSDQKTTFNGKKSAGMFGAASGETFATGILMPSLRNFRNLTKVHKTKSPRAWKPSSRVVVVKQDCLKPQILTESWGTEVHTYFIL